jgi:hypothetical protein
MSSAALPLSRGLRFRKSPGGLNPTSSIFSRHVCGVAQTDSCLTLEAKHTVLVS